MDLALGHNKVFGSMLCRKEELLAEEQARDAALVAFDLLDRAGRARALIAPINGRHLSHPSLQMILHDPHAVMDSQLSK